jgi:hypothetical protein
MDCRRVNELLPDYSVGVLDRRTHSAVAGHLADCPGCRGEMAAMEQAVALFEQHGALTPPPGLWNGVYNRLTTDTAPAPLHAWSGFRAPWNWLFQRPARAFAAGAAFLAIVAGLTFGPPGSETPPPPGPASAGLSVLMRQHALTQAEASLGERAVWEEQAGPATAANDESEDDSAL